MIPLRWRHRSLSGARAQIKRLELDLRIHEDYHTSALFGDLALNEYTHAQVVDPPIPGYPLLSIGVALAIFYLLRKK
jgi:hypothetical protein